jgi:hypothetical protein
MRQAAPPKLESEKAEQNIARGKVSAHFHLHLLSPTHFPLCPLAVNASGCVFLSPPSRVFVFSTFSAAL